MNNGKSEGQKTRKRDASGKWVKGCGPGPGRPKGEPCTVARLLRGKWVDDAEQIADMIKEKALAGDLEAAKIVLERIYPRPKDGPVLIHDMPRGSVAEMTGRVVQAVADGSLTPSEGQALAGILAQHCKIIETHELAQRVEEIKQRLDEQEKKL
jgi:hypothetical protein